MQLMFNTKSFDFLPQRFILLSCNFPLKDRKNISRPVWVVSGRTEAIRWDVVFFAPTNNKLLIFCSIENGFEVSNKLFMTSCAVFFLNHCHKLIFSVFFMLI